MASRAQCRPLLRLAQRRVSEPIPRCFRSIPSPPSTIVVQRFSTSPRRRQDPTPAGPPPAPPAPPVPPELTPNQSKDRKGSRLAPRLIFAAAFLLLGSFAGSSARLLVSPPTPPEPGSEEDEYTISVLHDQASKLPIVKQLSSDPAWESWNAYNTLPPGHRRSHIAAGALRGSRGVGGYQRIFYNKDTGELISVIYFGASTIGWPGVVHGGCLATILDESCGRAAFKQWGGLTGVTASLTLQYKKATLANGFYVIKVKPRAEEDLPESERGKRHYKCYVDATVVEPASGQVNIIADALFVGGEGRKGKKKNNFWGGNGKADAHAQF
ncbi:putative mitochondrial membrane protein FMP10 [Cladorrhinum samala]|uniref:Mitochondrial membrane protein FMP10 n=1 Tax=Cladorrhinum samala TaxID=585594 RepID=A0AAV9HN00_9PEZI|nr:putative mitochondrial membrane protein FMP10 [Cladorrhinum samala]